MDSVNAEHLRVYVRVKPTKGNQKNHHSKCVSYDEQGSNQNTIKLKNTNSYNDESKTFIFDKVRLV